MDHKYLNNIVITIYILIIILLIFIHNYNKIIKYIHTCYLHYTLLDILSKTIKIFDKHGIKYWAIGGTLLGSIREGKIIYHDDDIDLSIDIKDKIKIKNNYNNIIDDFNKNGLHLSFYVTDINYDHIFKIVKIKNKYMIDMEYGSERNKDIINNIFIDVFPFTMINEKYTYAYSDHRKWWPKSYFLEDEVFPLKKGKLNNLEISIPNKSIKFLERFFGDCSKDECWKIPKITHDHSHEINISLFN